MKREDLIQKLEDTEPPQAELPGYQKRLKMALLQADYLHRRQPGATILELAKSILEGAKDAMIKSLLSRQPVWKTATVAVLAVALVLGLSFAIPPLGGDSVYAQAEEIANNSDEVRQRLGPDGEIQVVKVIDMADNKGTVYARGELGIVSFGVDLDTNEVTDVVTLLELTPEGEQSAIDIVKADAEVQALLDDGAVIGEVSTMFVCGATCNVATGVVEEFYEALVTVEIIGSDATYTAQVDLAAGEMKRLTEMPPAGTPDTPPATGEYFVPDPDIDGSS